MPRPVLARTLVLSLAALGALAGLAARSPRARACCGEDVREEVLSFSADGSRALAERVVENWCLRGHQVVELVVLDVATGAELERLEPSAEAAARAEEVARLEQQRDALERAADVSAASPARAQADRAVAHAVELRRGALRGAHLARFPLRARQVGKAALRWRQRDAETRVLELRRGTGWVVVAEREAGADEPVPVALPVWRAPGGTHALVLDGPWYPGPTVASIELATGLRRGGEGAEVAALRAELFRLARAEREAAATEATP